MGGVRVRVGQDPTVADVVTAVPCVVRVAVGKDPSVARVVTAVGPPASWTERALGTTPMAEKDEREHAAKGSTGQADNLPERLSCSWSLGGRG
jgi:hypothetical protein